MTLLSLIRKYYNVTYMENTYGLWLATPILDPEDIPAQGVLENLLGTLVARIACDWFPEHKVNLITKYKLRQLLEKRRIRRYNIVQTDKGVTYEPKYELQTAWFGNNPTHYYHKRIYKNKNV